MKTITIKEMGNATIKPDLIVVTIRLESEDKEYDKALSFAANKIEELNKSLEEIGFNKNAIKTTSFNVHTKYENIRDNNVYKNIFKGYVCIHNLKIEFTLDIKKLSQVLSVISNCLAKPEFEIAFTIKDSESLKKELLKSIANNAKEKAMILCEASNVKLGELLSISYNFDEINLLSNTNYKVESSYMMKAEARCTSIDIEPEDIKINDSATFVWEIK